MMSLWAKKNKDKSHLLIYHMIDTAMCTQILWDSVLQKQIKQKIAKSIYLDGDIAEAGKLISFWAGLHDLGKADKSFQDLESNRQPHNVLSMVAIERIFNDSILYTRISKIIGGHHGTFPLSCDFEKADRRKSSDFIEKCKVLTQNLINILEIPHDHISITKDLELDNSVSIILSGLISTCDWIASNEDLFPYEQNIINLTDYMEISKQRAKAAVDNVLKWSHWEPAEEVFSFSQLFPEIKGSPRPLQQKAIEISNKLNGPSLLIVEAPTGEGKTEAAMLLADYFLTSQKQKGIYFALPTQATSNQMFGRVKDFLNTRYDNKQFNFMLQHGHASLSEEFNVLQENSKLLTGLCVGDGSDTNSNAIASSWFTYKKRGLLAPFGVGTIDQVLMSVLQTKHFFIRLFGLASKTIIIDEVHAYDTYMTTLLERLLEWLAALDCNVILLSATLPKNRTKMLIEAYSKGKQSNVSLESTHLATYPRLSYISDTVYGSETFDTCQLNQKSYNIKWVDGRLPGADQHSFTLGEELKASLSEGGCVAVICNTVKRCQRVYTALKNYFPEDELSIFHARYLFKDRAAREKQTLEWFGKDRSSRPSKMIIVTTQVIEQSLDIDFDLMVTDMAPVDLILQRGGRLHRHELREGSTRALGLREPQLWIVKPESVAEGVPTFDNGTEAVYSSSSHILFRSWLSLKDREGVTIPVETEGLIESVYDNRECIEGLTENQQTYWHETLQKDKSKYDKLSYTASTVNILPPYYEDDIFEDFNQMLLEDSPESHRTRQALTRMQDIPSVNTVLLFEDNSVFYIDIEKTQTINPNQVYTEQIKKIINNSININDFSIAPWLWKNGEHPTSWDKSKLLRNLKLISLSDNSVNIANKNLTYCPVVGLLIEKRSL